MSFLYRLKETLKNTVTRPRRLVLLLLGFLVISVLPLAYRESWLDPFTTLNVPDRLLKPHAITVIAYVPNDNPTQTLVLKDHARVQELMHYLAAAKPVREAEPQATETTIHLTLHRVASRFHGAADFALEFDPQNGLVEFAGQFFRLPEAGQLYLTNLPKSMQPGWVN